MSKTFLVAAAVGAVLLAGPSVAHEGEPHVPAKPVSTAAHAEHGKKGEHAHGAAIGMPGADSEVSRTVKVDMTDAMRFRPSTMKVKRGETVRFVVSNSGKLRHEMVLGSMSDLKKHAAMMRKMPEMEHADENMVLVEPGKSGELIWKFTKAGKIDFACLQPGHFEAGMKGKVAVK